MPSRLLRVVICALQYYTDHPGGADRLAFDEAVFLADRGHEVWIVAQDTSRGKPEYAFEGNLHVLRYASPQLRLFDPRRIRFHQLRSSQLLAKYLAAKPIDLVHGHSLLQYDAALSLRSHGTRACYSVHSPAILEMRAAGRGATIQERAKLWLTGRLAHNLERRCLERSHSITAESRYTVSLIQMLHGDEIARRIRVVPGWADTKRFQIAADRRDLKGNLSWPTDVPVFFTVRRLVARMGLDKLLYALQQVKAAGWQFYMVIGGAGPLRVQLEGMISQLGLSDCVRLAGFVPDDLLPIMYAAADAFVLPTAELECFGIIALESLACGRPVLATPVGAIPEILQQVEPRWLTRDASPEAIAERLVDFLRGDLPVASPERLRDLVVQNYSYDTVIDRLVRTAMGEMATVEERGAK